MLHRLWLELGDQLPEIEPHHHDIVRLRSDEVAREISLGQGQTVVERLRNHLKEMTSRRIHP